jgi:putative ABC transport system ATP-binding protein
VSLAIHATALRYRYPASGAPGFELVVPHWQVAAGARAAVRGPSGTGKSTLLKLVSGELRPSDGQLFVGGRPLHAMTDRARRVARISDLGFVFQDFPLVGYLGALDNVLLPYRLNPALTLDDDAWSRGAALLEELGLGDKHSRRPAHLSQGERQRVAIARALVTQPTLLLADEPTAGLDPARSAALLDLLERLGRERGLTLVVVSHDPSVLERFDRVLDLGQPT